MKKRMDEIIEELRGISAILLIILLGLVVIVFYVSHVHAEEGPYVVRDGLVFFNKTYVFNCLGDDGVCKDFAESLNSAHERRTHSPLHLNHLIPPHTEGNKFSDTMEIWKTEVSTWTCSTDACTEAR